jgi:hypothetical protein
MVGEFPWLCLIWPLIIISTSRPSSYPAPYHHLNIAIALLHPTTASTWISHIMHMGALHTWPLILCPRTLSNFTPTIWRMQVARCAAGGLWPRSQYTRIFSGWALCFFYRLQRWCRDWACNLECWVEVLLNKESRRAVPFDYKFGDFGKFWSLKSLKNWAICLAPRVQCYAWPPPPKGFSLAKPETLGGGPFTQTLKHKIAYIFMEYIS